jgi:vitamin B12 transporter
MKSSVIRARLGVLPLALAAAFPCFAQSQTQLGETVVTATRTAQPIGDVVADVTIIDREQIERSGAVGLADVLARVPGLQITRNGGVGNNSTVLVRGGESRHTLVLIDGVKIDSQSTGGGASFSTIPLSQIDRIEIVRGPSSAVYGSDAVAGTIQIFTKKGQGSFAPAVTLGYGSYNTRRVEFAASGAAGAFDYSFGVADESSDGYNIQPNVANRNPDADGYKSQSGNLKLGFQLNREHRFEIGALQSRMDAQTDGTVLAEGDTRNITMLQTLSGQWAAQWTSNYSTKISLNESTDEGDTPRTPLNARSTNRTKIRTVGFGNELRLGAHLLSATLEQKKDGFYIDGTTAVPAGQRAIEREKSQDSLALGYGWSAGAHTVQLNARRDEDSEFGGRNTGSAAYAFAITPQWKATAGTGTSFRVPTIYQRFSKYGVATLQPETGRNVEFGLRYAQGSSSFSAVAYRNRVTNLLQFTTGNGPCLNGGPPVAPASRSCYSNVGRAEYTGITLAGTHSLGGYKLSASLDLENPKNQITDRTLARRSRQHATLGIDKRIGAWSFASDLPGYALLNLSATTALARDWKLIARLDNLADKTYQTANGYAMPQRTLYVGVTWAPQ